MENVRLSSKFGKNAAELQNCYQKRLNEFTKIEKVKVIISRLEIFFWFFLVVFQFEYPKNYSMDVVAVKFDIYTRKQN